MNYLGIDYGLMHVGLAVAYSPLAEPLETVATREALDYISQFVDAEDIDEVVVGLPEGEMEEMVENFVEDLQLVINVPIVLHDETLSSHEAGQKLQHARKSIRSGPDHQYAAALILQDYLDHEVSTE